MKRRIFIFRWIRIAFCALLSAMAIMITTAWLKPDPGTTNHQLVLADEGHRYNIYALWNSKYYHLRTFPDGVFVVPHRFVVFLQMIGREDGDDLLSIEYRKLTTKAIAPRHIQLLPTVYFQRYSIAPDPQTPAQVGWHLTIPVWVAVLLLWMCPAITLVRGPIRRWRRRRRGLCETCRYDLSGLTERRCPECGTLF